MSEATKRFRVYGTMSASVFIGEYEAVSKKAALDLAENDTHANWNPSICHQCSEDVEVGHIYETQVEEASQ